MNVQIEPTWKEYLQGEFEKPYFEQLTQSVRQEYTAGTCYPQDVSYSMPLICVLSIK